MNRDKPKHDIPKEIVAAMTDWRRARPYGAPINIPEERTDEKPACPSGNGGRLRDRRGLCRAGQRGRRLLAPELYAAPGLESRGAATRGRGNT